MSKDEQPIRGGSVSLGDLALDLTGIRRRPAERLRTLSAGGASVSPRAAPREDPRRKSRTSRRWGRIEIQRWRRSRRRGRLRIG